jgi:heme a synthase
LAQEGSLVVETCVGFVRILRSLCVAAEASSHMPHRIVHLLAWLLALSIFPLLWFGGMVTSKGAGMSVPDWPNTFGYNMFLVPWEKWSPWVSGGVFWEHSHRLLGAWAGVVAIALVVSAWVVGRQRWVGVYATLLLVCICIQGIKGGLRVTESSLTLAIAHGIFAQIVFCASCLFVLLTSQTWLTKWSMVRLTGDPLTGDRLTGDATRSISRKVRWLLSAVVVLCVVQLSIGAVMRHQPNRGVNGGPGLAIPDWPLHYGKVMPPMSRAKVEEVNQLRPFTYNLPPIEVKDVHLHFTHRLGAYTLATVALVAGVFMLTKFKGMFSVKVGGAVLIGLVAMQITWGVLTVLYRKPADIATLHQATGALLFMTSVVMCCISWVWTQRSAIEVMSPSMKSGRRMTDTLAQTLAGANPKKQVESHEVGAA